MHGPLQLLAVVCHRSPPGTKEGAATADVAVWPQSTTVGDLDRLFQCVYQLLLFKEDPTSPSVREVERPKKRVKGTESRLKMRMSSGNRAGRALRLAVTLKL